LAAGLIWCVGPATGKHSAFYIGWLRRAGFAQILRQLGASEKLLDRLTDGDVAAVLTELKAQARAGDPPAINMPTDTEFPLYPAERWTHASMSREMCGGRPAL
jgi:hypothetical protein